MAELSGATNAKIGLFSIWINPASDGVTGHIYNDKVEGTSLGFQFARVVGNTLVFQAWNPTSTTILRLNSTSTLLTVTGWRHILASWNLATGAGTLYLDDTADTDLVTASDVLIDYTIANHSVGAQSAGADKFDGDIADLYFDQGTFLDLSVEANRRLFIDPNKNPVDLGEAGQFPTGSSPIIYFSGPIGSWETNKGTGGGFTETGTITEATTSPSD